MRKLLLAALLTTAGLQAETIDVKVNGMVCAFCSEGIEKAFKKRPELESMKVDLKTKVVSLKTKEKASLDDALITKIISDAGFTVVTITRG